MNMKIADLKNSGHWPTLLTAFLYFDFSFMAWTLLGPLGVQIGVALRQAGRWYPPNMQGFVMGLAGAGNIGTVLDALFAPRLATAYGWQAVFGLALIPAVLVLIAYACFSKEAPITVKVKKLRDYF